jgi:hypothetical protein
VELMNGQNCEKAAQRGLQHTRGEAPTTEFWPKPDGVPAFAITSNEGRGESTKSLIKTNNYDYFDTANECGNERQRLWCRKRRRRRLTERRVWWDHAMIASLRQRSLARGEESFALEAKMFRRRGRLRCLIFQTLCETRWIFGLQKKAVYSCSPSALIRLRCGVSALKFAPGAFIC